MCTEEEMIKFFDEKTHCGINSFYLVVSKGKIINIRKRKANPWPNRTLQKNEFFFIEFADSVSVLRALNVASRREAVINRRKFRIFKAGTNTFLCKSI